MTYINTDEQIQKIMSNIANIQKLNYCESKFSNTRHCSCVAEYQIKLASKKDALRYKTIATKEWSYRCEEHKSKGTKSKIVVDVKPLDQSYSLHKINQYLKTIIGKTIKSSFHTAKGLEVKYLKNNGAVMCFQPITKKWKLVYYNQIEQVLTIEQEPERSVATKPLS